MQAIGFAFLDGLFLLFSPYLLSILPVSLVAGVEGGKKRPLGIILGVIFGFTLLSSLFLPSLNYRGIDFQWIRHTACALLFLFGFILFFTTKKSSDVSSASRSSGFIGGMSVGGLWGIIWFPFKSVVLSASSPDFFLTEFPFILGVGICILLMIFIGQQGVLKIHFLQENLKRIRKLSGLLMMVTVLWVSGWVLPLPSFLRHYNKNEMAHPSLTKGLLTPYPAPEIEGIDIWLNSSDAISLKDQQGRIVLVHFWSYSCQECLTDLPYLSDWYRKYHDQGLDIIGIHIPESDREKNFLTLIKVLEKHQIEYPVALDNLLVTSKAYHLSKKPTQFLINQKGDVVYTPHSTKDYEGTEKNICALLGVNCPSPLK